MLLIRIILERIKRKSKMGKYIVSIYSGETEIIEIALSHPYRAAMQGKSEIDNIISERINEAIFHTNSTDFASAMYYYVQINNLPIEFRFYLNKERVGSLEDLFEDWNRSLSFIGEI